MDSACAHANLSFGALSFQVPAMKMNEVVGKIKTAPRDGIICARRPWSSTSDCVIALPTAELGVPVELQQQQLDYFLEVAIAQEVLGAIGRHRGRELDLLIHYATYDGYPDWLYA